MKVSSRIGSSSFTPLATINKVAGAIVPATLFLPSGDDFFMTPAGHRPSTLKDLRASGWVSKTVKHEIRDNFLRMLQGGAELFPGIIGYENTVIPEINL